MDRLLFLILLVVPPSPPPLLLPGKPPGCREKTETCVNRSRANNSKDTRISQYMRRTKATTATLMKQQGCEGSRLRCERICVYFEKTPSTASAIRTLSTRDVLRFIRQRLRPRLPKHRDLTDARVALADHAHEDERVHPELLELGRLRSRDVLRPNRLEAVGLPAVLLGPILADARSLFCLFSV